MVLAPGPGGLDSCVLSRGPKIDWDMLATSAAPEVFPRRRRGSFQTLGPDSTCSGARGGRGGLGAGQACP